MKNYQFEKIAITINQRKAGGGGTIVFYHDDKTYYYSVGKFTIKLPPDNNIFYEIVADNVQPTPAPTGVE